MGEDRPGFLNALVHAGVEALGDRTGFTNALLRAVRLGLITKGWGTKKLPDECAHCGSLPAANKKLLVCGRCKVAKYCNATCQKAHWAAGHKGACKRPDPTLSEQWKEVDDLGGYESYQKSRYMQRVGVGGNGGGPILIDGHSCMVNGVVKDTRDRSGGG